MLGNRNSIFNNKGLLKALKDDDEIVKDSDSNEQRIQEVIDFLEEKIDFFSSLFENFQYSSRWCEQNKDLSNGFFDALHDKLFKEFMVRAEFRGALIGNLEENSPNCLKNGKREKMQDWLSNNEELTSLLHNNRNNKAIEKWYKQHRPVRRKSL